VRRVHAGLHLENESAERGFDRRRLPSTSAPPGGGASDTSTSSSWFTPKFSAAEVNSTGELSPARNESRS
jgi:hypothetical protein